MLDNASIISLSAIISTHNHVGNTPIGYVAREYSYLGRWTTVLLYN